MSSQALQRRVRDAAKWAPSLASVRSEFSEKLDLGEEALHCICVPAPLAHVDALIAGFADEASFLWDPPQGAALVGVGAVAEVRPEPGRSLRAAVEELFSKIRYDAPAGAPPLRVVGGMSFAPGSADRAPWSEFGDGVFVLPRWMYVLEDGAAWLVFAKSKGVEGRSEQSIDPVSELEAVWQSLLWEEQRSSKVSAAIEAKHTPQARWSSEVIAIRDAIARGEVEKVVAARESCVELTTDCEAMDLLSALEQRFPGCTRFAMWRGAATFLGATPESLIAKQGVRVYSEALAGSVPPGQAESMLSSLKEREEHQYVVDAIVEVLKPLCRALHLGSTPEVRELPDLLHLQTPIEGELLRDTHVLDLVEALHPTPAVGGVPADRALSWIVEHEAAPRGWYSAPFGWVDTSGDGEFVVALRSGLVQGHHAWLYAGAGIVRDSEPPAEYRETELKMQALLGAFDGSV